MSIEIFNAIDRIIKANAQVIVAAANSIIARVATDSATAFQVQNAAGTTTVLNVDTANGRVGIGTTAPSQRLHITSTAGTHGLRLDNSGYPAYYGEMRYDASGVGGMKFELSHSSSNWSFINGNVGIGTTTPATQIEAEQTTTITGAVADGYAAALTLDPGYTAATAQTVTRHNYLDIQDVSVAGAGPAAVTNAAVLRFDAAVGTHKALAAASTKATPGGVDGWVKINVNGTLMYLPAYLSTTA